MSIEDRERARRSRLVSWIVLGLLVTVLVLVPGGLAAFGTLVAIGLALVGLLLATALNRLGFVSSGGVLLVLVISGAVLYAIGSVPQLGLVYLPAYDLFVISTIVAASVLPSLSVFAVAALNVGVMLTDFLLQPHGPDLTSAIASYGAVAMVERPIALQVVVAVIAFLWVRGTNQAIRRADRAEEIAALEHSIAEQKRQLDLGIEQIRETHIRAANGDFSARAPLSQENVLWQIAASLNNLLARLQRAGHAEHQLRRTEEELRRLAAAIDDAQSGRRPIWPAPSGTAADFIITRINRNPRGSTPLSGPRDRGYPDPMTPAAPPSQPWTPAAPSQPWAPAPPSGPAGPSGPSQPLRDDWGRLEGERMPSNPWVFPIEADDSTDGRTPSW